MKKQKVSAMRLLNNDVVTAASLGGSSCKYLEMIALSYM